ncbi:MAG: 7-cyano-7-deazaguanine synthase QueC [Bdellovibrio sp.]|nr:MAG: 7-cyano-7-deazaguanine synthase QueC [Bdellovibrio sp.]
MEKSVVLLSGGLDSTVNLYDARVSTQVVLALTFDYGQKAAAAELRSAKRICDTLGIPHRILQIPFVREWGTSSLIDEKSQIPRATEVAIDDLAISRNTARSVWVPNRNGILMNIAAGFAESLGAQWVVPGFNAEEAATFPDNSNEFLHALTNSFSFSTANKVKAACSTVRLNKIEIVKKGISLGVDFALIWPCYLSGERWCGSCESCQRTRRAFAALEIPWPA